ncbi:MAG: DHHA2 domain-containing protein [Thermodesulfobacteriota bacterium]
MSFSSLHTYLAACREQVVSKKAKKLVIGNEAADLDSMASSIVYAYYLASKNSNDNLSIIPVMPIPREDFKLRTEAVYVFEKGCINLDDVIFFDEINFAGLMAGDAQLVLVDHNKLAVSLETYGNKVVEILDHHRDEKLYPQASKKIIEMVGSTTTLVGDELLNDNSDIINDDIAMLLAGTILLDTVNLDPEAGRVTPKDDKVAGELLKKCSIGQDKYFENVQREKFNVSDLDTTDLLRKDYKEWNFGNTSCGIASALLPVTQWAEKDNTLCQGFSAYADTRGLDILLAMNAYTNPGFNRDLVIFVKNAGVHDELVNYLHQQGLELNELEISNQEACTAGKISCYSQGNLGISRKKLQPMLVFFFR